MKKQLFCLTPAIIFPLTGVACSLPNNDVIETKITRNGPIEISVSSETEGHEGDKLNDDNFATYWQADKLENQVVELNLKSIRLLDNVTQIFNEEDIWYFKIEASVDNTNFFTLLDNSFGVFGRVFSRKINGFAQYIRMTIIKSQKGFFPNSREFFVNSRDETQGINVSYGISATADSSHKHFPALNAFGGDYGTYWCRGDGADFSNGIKLRGEWPGSKTVLAHSIEISLPNFCDSEFQLSVTSAETNEEVIIAPRQSRTGSFYKFNLVNELHIKAVTYTVYRDDRYKDKVYWASVSEINVIGFEDIGDEINKNHLCYIDRVELNHNCVVINNKKYDSINNNVHAFANRVDGLGVNNRVYGFTVESVLNYYKDATVSTFLDEDHHITYATRPNINNVVGDKYFFQAEKKEETAIITFDLGAESLITRFTQKYHESAKHHFRIEASLDNVEYKTCYYQEDSGKGQQEYECNLDQPCKARYIRLILVPNEGQTATCEKFYIYGIGSPVQEEWWQNTSGVIRFYPKLQPTTLKEITNRLDEFRYSGYRVIELHQPYEGVANIWAGLGGTDNYQIDPIIGNFADFNNLIKQAHARGIKIFMFGNVGYGKYNSELFKKAEKDIAKGVDSLESKCFRFSKTIPKYDPSAQPAQNESDPHFDKTRWYYSDVANAYFYEFWQRGGDIPTYNFEEKAWQQECANYINFWANSGLDGIALDAPSAYDFGLEYEGKDADGKTYEEKCSEITYKNITHTLRKNKLFSIPEGNGETKFIGDYKYRAVQNYGMTSWGAGGSSLSMDAARKHLGADNLDQWVKNVHDEAVGLGGVAVNGMNFEDVYDNATDIERYLESALATTTGHMAFLHLGSDKKIGQDIMKKWPIELQKKIARSFALQNSLSSLNPSGERRMLMTGNNLEYYAFYRADMSSKDRSLVVFNYQDEDRDVKINIINSPLQTNDEHFQLYDAFNDETIDITNLRGNITIPMNAYSHRVLIRK